MAVAWGTVEGTEAEEVSVDEAVAVVDLLLARAPTDQALMAGLLPIRTEATQVIEPAAPLLLLRDVGPSGEWC